MEAITDVNTNLNYIINVCSNREYLDKAIFRYNDSVLRRCDAQLLLETMERLTHGSSVSVTQAQVYLHINCILYEQEPCAIDLQQKAKALSGSSSYIEALIDSVDHATLMVLCTGDAD